MGEKATQIGHAELGDRAPTYQPQFRAGQRANDLLLQSQGRRLADGAGASRLFSGLEGAANIDLVPGFLLGLMPPDNPAAVIESDFGLTEVYRKRRAKSDTGLNCSAATGSQGQQ